jgi:hypothetical protein
LAAAADQLRDVGIRRPCVVLGNGGWNAPTAYALGCTNVDTGPAGIKDIVADGGTVVWLSTKGPAITPGVEWRRVLVRYSTKVKKYVYLSAPVLRTAPIRTIR